MMILERCQIIFPFIFWRLLGFCVSRPPHQKDNKRFGDNKEANKNKK